MFPKTIERYDRVRKLVESGKLLGEALKSESMGAATYYSARKEVKKLERKKPDKVAKQAQEFFDIASPQPGEHIAVVVCTVGNLRKVLAGI